MSTDPVDDVALWLSWKRVSEVTRGRILADVIAQSPLTEPELTVLVHLDEASGALRQNALAAAAGWDRTRLSHLLTRMEERRYLTRCVSATESSSPCSTLAATPWPRRENHWLTPSICTSRAD